MITISDCRGVVGMYFKISRKDMISKTRTRDIARPRMMAMVLAREFTGASYPRVGAHFGGRDHTTCLSAMKRVARLEREDEDIRAIMGQFRIALAHHAIFGPQTFTAPCVTPQTFTARQEAP